MISSQVDHTLLIFDSILYRNLVIFELILYKNAMPRRKQLQLSDVGRSTQVRNPHPPRHKLSRSLQLKDISNKHSPPKSRTRTTNGTHKDLNPKPPKQTVSDQSIPVHRNPQQLQQERVGLEHTLNDRIQSMIFDRLTPTTYIVQHISSDFKLGRRIHHVVLETERGDICDCELGATADLEREQRSCCIHVGLARERLMKKAPITTNENAKAILVKHRNRLVWSVKGKSGRVIVEERSHELRCQIHGGLPCEHSRTVRTVNLPSRKTAVEASPDIGRLPGVALGPDGTDGSHQDITIQPDVDCQEISIPPQARTLKSIPAPKWVPMTLTYEQEHSKCCLCSCGLTEVSERTTIVFDTVTCWRDATKGVGCRRCDYIVDNQRGMVVLGKNGFTYQLLELFSSFMVHNTCTFTGFTRSMNKNYTQTNSGQFAHSESFSHGFQIYIRNQALSHHYSCNLCGPYPRFVIVDGTNVNFPKRYSLKNPGRDAMNDEGWRCFGTYNAGVPAMNDESSEDESCLSKAIRNPTTRFSRICNKRFIKRSDRSGGILVLWCSCSCALGFHLINGCEGRKDPFFAIQCRFPFNPSCSIDKRPTCVIYDYACDLSRYAKRYNNSYYHPIQFAIDEFHSRNHLCKGFRLSEVIKDEMTVKAINTSAAEIGNSTLGRIKRISAYSNQTHMYFITRHYLSLRNAEIWVQQESRFQQDLRLRDILLKKPIPNPNDETQRDAMQKPIRYQHMNVVSVVTDCTWSEG